MGPAERTEDKPRRLDPTARTLALLRTLLDPFDRFLRVEAASGVVLFASALAALALANSSIGSSYERVLEVPFGARIGAIRFEQPLRFWINDGLMTVFFFVVGLEIRHELHIGELADSRHARLPIAAALGGMIAPAVIYLAIAGWDPALRPGWGIPMATDVAFAVGVLSLLGSRVPAALRILVLALAIIDDIGSIVVIAVFYSGPIHADGIAIALAGVVVTVFGQRLGARRAAVFLVPGLVVWLGTLRSGIHPTIAGVVLGLLTPASPWIEPQALADEARATAERLEHELQTGTIGHVDLAQLATQSNRLERARREALAPAARVQMMLHPWVAFVVMPLFAFTNAGVSLRNARVLVSPESLAIAAGLLIGKPLGVIGASLLATRFAGARRPTAVGWRELVVLGSVSSIGFTMSLFIAALAFENALLGIAKFGVLVSSGMAVLMTLAIGRILLERR